MDWKTAGTVLVSVVSIVASAWVAIRTKSIDAVAKQADRQHERELAYEQRVWELKNAALTTVIDACYDLLGEAERSGDSPISPRRARVVTGMERFRARVRGSDGVMGQLLAYAANPVRKAVDQLLDMIEAERNLHVMDLYTLSRLEPGLAEVKQEMQPGSDPLDVHRRYVELNQAIAQRKDQIATRSKLDVDKVVALCNQIIDAARDDLRAKPVDEGRVQRPAWWQRMLRLGPRRIGSRATDSA